MSGERRNFDDWEELADRAGAPPFLRPGWFEQWLAAFGDADSLDLVEVRHEDRLAALLPVLRQGRRVGSPVNWHTPAFGPLAVDAAARDELCRSLFETAATSVQLDLLDAENGTLAALEERAREAGRRVISRVVTRPPYIVLDGDFATYEKRLSRNRRKALKRHRRRLEEEGSVRFEVHDGSTDLERLLEQSFAIEASGWKGERGTAISSRPDTRAFYAGVARWAAGRGWLRLAFLYLEDRPIACDYALEHGGSWYTLKSGYDERFRSFGPGALLLRDEIAHCCERGDVERMELLGEPDEFKSSWTDESSERVRLRAFRRTPAGTLGWSRTTAEDRARSLLHRWRSRR